MGRGQRLDPSPCNYERRRSLLELEFTANSIATVCNEEGSSVAVTFEVIDTNFQEKQGRQWLI